MNNPKKLGVILRLFVVQETIATQHDPVQVEKCKDSRYIIGLTFGDAIIGAQTSSKHTPHELFRASAQTVIEHHRWFSALPIFDLARTC